MKQLNPREREVLALYVAKGQLTLVAEALGRSLHTVESHKDSIMRKLHAKSSVEITYFALRNGLVKL